MNMLRLLEKKDFIQYLNLLRKFKPIDITITEEKFSKIFDDISKTSQIWVYILNDNIVGTITIMFEQKFINNLGKVAHIEDLYVDFRHRNKGIGKNLFEKVLRLSKYYNCYKCVLNCDNSLVNYYKKYNFEINGNFMAIYY